MMKNTKRSNTAQNSVNPSSRSKSRSRSRSWKAVVIALYITFILLSTIPFAADRTLDTSMNDSYTHHLRYPRDGQQTHYYVERTNTSQIGKIDLTYTTASNSLVVKTENLNVLHIFCRSLYEDECRDVYGIDPEDNSNYYKWYFIEKDHFNVNIDSDTEIKELSFIDTPFAYKVVVNGDIWEEGVDYFYTENDGIALSTVPEGRTRVDLYFKPPNDANVPPTAVLSVSKTLVPIDHSITFDASESYDVDGEIISYVLDLGDNNYRGGVNNSYYYSKPGVYGVILRVRDDDYLVDHAYVNITVVQSADIPDIQGRVPDQEKLEDAPPWTLDLSTFEPVSSKEDLEFNWYITGENTSLYTVIGENSSDNKLIFTLVPDAYGSNLVTLWLRSTKDISVSQQLYINITSVNDAPTISNIPDLIIHYDEEYTFNYWPYVNDIETPRQDLVLDIYDGFDETYITFSGLKATYSYPHKLLGETVYATVTVSDGEAFAQDLITIQITSDHVPKLVNELPDLWLFEGTTIINVFDLDDYFTDPDNDAIFFSTGQTHLEIMIHIDHTVEVSSFSEWTGSELVTFRARDPIGAIAEDMIVITVLPVNDPPSISGVPNIVVHYDKNYRFDLTPFVHDKDNTTDELRIISSDLENIQIDPFNNLVIIMNYPIDYLDITIPVRLTVSDGLNQSFQDIIVTVTDDYPPELIAPIPDIVFLEDMALSNVFDLDHYFLDIDGDALFYTTGNNFINITINDDHTVGASAPRDWFGNEQVIFRATDPTGGLQQDLVLVSVLPVNDAPILLDIPIQYGNESERWSLDLTPYIIDVDNNITELEITVDSDQIVVTGSNLVFLGTKDLPKAIEVTVSDGEYVDSKMVEIDLKLNKRQQTPTLWDLMVMILPFIILLIIMILLISSIIVIRRTRFKAEEVFLIHQGGTLITHLTRNQQANVDDIIFSGMFTAVQEFIKDTFSDTGTGSASADDAAKKKDKWVLDELKLGDNNILIERSENTYLAVIFTGPGSKRLRRIVTGLLDDIEDKYADILPLWDGNITALEGTKKTLSVLIDIPEVPEVPDEPEEPVDQTPTTTPEVTAASAIPKDRSTVEPHYPSADQINASLKSIVSKSIRSAKPIKGKKRKPVVRELLTCVGELAGTDKPGLTAWPMTSARKRTKRMKHKGIDKDKIPIAMHISPKRQKQKTIVINKNRSPVKAKPALIAKSAPHSLGGANFAKPVNVTMPGSKKPFTIDPNKSLLQQMAEMDN